MPRKMRGTAASLLATVCCTVAAAVTLLAHGVEAYIDCKQWYGKWGGSKDPGADAHDNYWITFGPAADISPAQVREAYRGWSHCGPAAPDVVSRYSRQNDRGA